MAIAKAASELSTSIPNGSQCTWITRTGCRERRSIGRSRTPSLIRDQSPVVHDFVSADDQGPTTEDAFSYPSFFLTNSFTNWGLAWPFDSLITWPTKNWDTVVFPPRYCSTCFGFSA